MRGIVAAQRKGERRADARRSPKKSVAHFPKQVGSIARHFLASRRASASSPSSQASLYSSRRWNSFAWSAGLYWPPATMTSLCKGIGADQTVGVSGPGGQGGAQALGSGP